MFDQDHDDNADQAANAALAASVGGSGDPGSSDTISELIETEPEYIKIRPAWYRIGRGLIFVVALLFFGRHVYNIGHTWYEEQLDPPGEPETEVAILVPPGATTANIGRLLQDKEIVPNSTFFRYYAEWNDEGNFQAGEYIMYSNSSAQQAIDILNQGPAPQTFQRFTIREGLWIDEMIPEIAAQLDGVTEAQLWTVLNTGQILPRYRPAGTTSWEGLLFPDTYEISEDADALEVLLKMSDEFTSVTGSLSYGTANTPLGLSAYEILIVASLIEAETRSAEERPLVASVIYNRLREGWFLGIDATCIYGTGDRRVQLTNDILYSDSPYNCRDVVGLPPTPINAPSKASLAAAIAPEESTYMYYVLADGETGRHAFAVTNDEFVRLKAECQEKGLC